MNHPDIGMLFGAQYYRPPFPGDDCWQRDLANMRALGFNTVKLWAVWNWIEREPGVFSFDELDRLMDLAHAQGLWVVINTIPEGAPYWTLEGNRDALYQTAGGEQVTYGGPANLPTAGWPGLCMDKPGAAELVRNFIRAVAAHCGAHPALLAIDVWNEPHLEPMFDYRDDMLCYCEHSRAAFTAWLRGKYGTLAALNAAWQRAYTDWAQVLPPPRIGTWTDMMDWRLFWLDNLRRWMRLRVEACRAGAPHIPVQSHVAYSGLVGTSGGGGLANELGDEFLLAREVDIFGVTCFPKWLMRKDPFFNHLINNEIVAEAAHGKPFYQVELQGGGGKAGLLGGEVPDARDIRLWNYTTLAVGGKGVTYWQYAPEPAGVESPGFGLTGFMGENTPRSLEAGRCAREMLDPLLASARRVRCENAIYLSRTTSVWFYGAERREALYAQAIHGFYKAAYLAGIPMGFFHQDDIAGLADSGVRTLCLPMPMTLSGAEIEALQAFVERGGTLVSEACPGLYTEAGLLDQGGKALEALFGLRHVEVQSLAEGETAVSMGSGFGGALYRQQAQPLDGTRVLESFADGAPSLTERAVGKGRAVWIGAYPALRFAQTLDVATGRLLCRELRRGGYPQFAAVRATPGQVGPPSLAPLIRLLETDTHWVMVAVNYLEQPAEIEVELAAGMAWDGQTTLRFALEASSGTWKAYSK